MKVIGVIPARYGSTRLPFKLLREVAGKPLIQWTWEAARKARCLDRLIIACDHSRIEEVARRFQAETVFTSPDHVSGTDRIAEAVADIDVDVAVNIQADEPLIHHAVIDSLVNAMKSGENLVMATVRKRLVDSSEINDAAVVKVVCDKDGYALYFSRLPIPYNRQAGSSETVYFKHLGIYAYTKDFLYTFKNLPPSLLEKSECLEQLRALEAGYKIKVIETNFDSLGVDTEDDLIAVRKVLEERSEAE